MTESEVWIRDKEQREEERLERCQRESGVGFKPPQQQEMRILRMKEQQEAVMSPTMSSITMRSEFDVSIYVCLW